MYIYQLHIANNFLPHKITLKNNINILFHFFIIAVYLYTQNSSTYNYLSIIYNQKYYNHTRCNFTLYIEFIYIFQQSVLVLNFHYCIVCNCILIGQNQMNTDYNLILYHLYKYIIIHNLILFLHSLSKYNDPNILCKKNYH